MNIHISFKSLAIAFIAFFTIATLSAQTEKPARHAPAPGTKKMKNGEDQEAKEFDRELNLTPDQKAAFKRADEQYREQARAHKDVSKADAQRLRDERKRAHKAALTADQQHKYDEIMAKRDVKMKNKKAAKKDVKKARKSEKKSEKSEKKAIKKELERQ